MMRAHLNSTVTLTDPLQRTQLLSSSSPSPLSNLLAADCVSDVLSFLSDESIVENPDARLRAFNEIVTYMNARCVGDFNSSKRFFFDPVPSSQESGSRLEASRWKWADVLMRGVTDAWSRIRAICLSPMADLILSEVQEALTLQRLAGNEQCVAAHPEHARLTHSAPGPSRRHSTGKLDEEKAHDAPAATGAGGERRRSLDNGSTHASAPPTAFTPAVNVSAPLDYVWRYWANSTRWYERDGIVRLLVKVYGRSRTIPGAALRRDEAGVRTLLFKVLFPAFRDPQLPVRESAATLLGVLVDRDRASPISPAVTSLIVDHISETLAKVPMPSRDGSPLTTVDQENTRVLEGNLLAVVVLIDMNVIQVVDLVVMPELLRLASYPASSVRQYIAQILRPPSPPVFVYLMHCLCGHDDQKLQRSEVDDSDHDNNDNNSGRSANNGKLNWQRLETVMMALQQHYLNITAIRATTHDWVHASSRSHDILALMRSMTPLSVVFHAMHSQRFEVARMGAQLFPLLLQNCVRFLLPTDMPCVCEACCGADGCMQRELNRLQAQGDAAALAKAQLSMATLVMPSLWFYLAVRRIEAEVTGTKSVRGVPSGAANTTIRAKVEKMIRPYATLERITFASQAHPSADSDGGTRTTTPCAASTCALLVLTAYHARVMDPAEWHRCVKEVLKPSWWVELLSDPVCREQVRFGSDFVRAVYHCGTPEEMSRVVELIPALTAALANAQTHQQCLIIAMIRVAVSVHACMLAPADERAMAYVYHDAYGAPALTEGGESAPLGHTWLKLFVPTQDAIPTTVFWGPVEEETGNKVKIVIRRDSDVFRALDGVCFKDLFQSTKTEMSVLRELRSLMMSLLRLGTHRPSCSSSSNGKHDDDGDVDWYSLFLEAIFGRLDKVSPRWRERTNDNDDGEAQEEEVEVEEEGGVCWDDWDDDEDDADGCAQGIYEAEAIKTTVAMVSALREWVAAHSYGSNTFRETDERFISELKALNIK